MNPQELDLNDSTNRQKILSDINTYKESLSKYQKIAPWGADAIRLQRSLDQANSQLASIDARISVSSKTIEPQKEQPSLIRQEFNKKMGRKRWDVTKSFDDAKLWTAINKLVIATILLMLEIHDHEFELERLMI